MVALSPSINSHCAPATRRFESVFSPLVGDELWSLKPQHLTHPKHINIEKKNTCYRSRSDSIGKFKLNYCPKKGKEVPPSRSSICFHDFLKLTDPKKTHEGVLVDAFSQLWHGSPSYPKSQSKKRYSSAAVTATMFSKSTSKDVPAERDPAIFATLWKMLRKENYSSSSTHFWSLFWFHFDQSLWICSKKVWLSFNQNIESSHLSKGWHILFWCVMFILTPSEPQKPLSFFETFESPKRPGVTCPNHHIASGA